MNETPFLLGLVLGALLATSAIGGYLVASLGNRRARRREETEAQVRRARDEAEQLSRSDDDRRRQELEADFRAQRQQLEARESAAANRSNELQRESSSLDQRRLSLEEREKRLEEQAQAYRQRLEQVSGWTVDEARQALRQELERESEDEVRELRAQILGRTDRELQEESRRLLLAVMQRMAGTPHHDLTATIVKLPSEDMKGRIIGREGRNIKSFESVTGTTLLIDETPDSVLVSSFDPVRREVARVALEALLRDGRIHPASIEEAVGKAEREVQESVIHYGEEAVRRLRLNKVHPEVIAALGRMHYRLANNQNVLDHSVEVANLSSLIAAEMGLDTNLAKRAGLFHDIGKVLSEEYEGSHALVGANFLKRFGTEDPRVLNAVAAHHEEVPAESPYVPLLMIADSLSAMRPGARAESIDSYLTRVRTLEDIARSFKGVTDAYAIQAGREIRVIVAPEQVDDAQARLLARDVRRRIEEEMQYPGTIKVTVIREARMTETAR